MAALTYQWRADGEAHQLALVRVPGTEGEPYLFGAGNHRRPIEMREFHIATTQVTQALWTRVMGSNPAGGGPGPRRPVEHVSWDHINAPGGFLDDMNGNVWEWCQDVCVDIDQVPLDATPWLGPGSERRLRGGCHDNWNLFVRVWWRCGIAPDTHDGCIGFRLVLAPGA